MRSSSRRSLSARGRRRAFFISHHPTLGFASQSERSAESLPRQRRPAIGADADVRHRARSRRTSKSLLSGHNHLLEILSFSSGSSAAIHHRKRRRLADQPFPVPFPMSKQPAPGAVIARFPVDDALRVHDDGARGEAGRCARSTTTGRPMTSCTVAARRPRARRSPIRCLDARGRSRGRCAARTSRIITRFHAGSRHRNDARPSRRPCQGADVGPRPIAHPAVSRVGARACSPR